MANLGTPGKRGMPPPRRHPCRPDRPGQPPAARWLEVVIDPEAKGQGPGGLGFCGLAQRFISCIQIARLHIEADRPGTLAVLRSSTHIEQGCQEASQYLPLREP